MSNIQHKASNKKYLNIPTSDKKYLKYLYTYISKELDCSRVYVKNIAEGVAPIDSPKSKEISSILLKHIDLKRQLQNNHSIFQIINPNNFYKK